MSVQGRSVLLSDILKADDVETLSAEIAGGYKVKATLLARAVRAGANNIVEMLTTEFTADYGEQLIALLNLTVGAEKDMLKTELVDKVLTFALKAYLGSDYQGKLVFQKAGTMGLKYIIQLSNTEKDDMKNQINAALRMIAIKTVRDFEKTNDTLSAFLREFDFVFTRKVIPVEEPRTFVELVSEIPRREQQVEEKEVLNGGSMLDALYGMSEEQFSGEDISPNSEEEQQLEGAAMKFVQQSEAYFTEKMNRNRQFGPTSAVAALNRRDFVGREVEDRKRTAGIPGLSTLFT